MSAAYSAEWNLGVLGGDDGGRFLYFAYGSNMNRARMLSRCPGARKVGTGTVGGWAVVERLYADLERRKGERTAGVVWSITRDDLAALDRAEGFPFVYDCLVARVRMGRTGREARCLVYIMTQAAREARDGTPYPEWYRAICSEGARANGVRDVFAAAARVG